MRAVNLIPADQQRGAGGAAGRSNGGAYILLGALALVVAMAAAYTLTGKSINDKKAKLAAITREAQAAETQASSLGSYTKFAALRQTREQTVSQLASGRFDWSHALHELARVLPDNAWLTSMTGTVSPSVNVGGGGGATGLRGALAVPAIEISGCTTSQSSVARMMARMRLIDGVQRVSLQDSAKNDVTGSSAGVTSGAVGGDDCRGASSHFPQFHMVVFFNQPANGSVATTATGGQAVTASSTTTPASTTTPGSTTSSSPATGGTTP